MRLSAPGNFDILQYLDDNGRNVAANIHLGIGKSRGYVNSELGKLEHEGLVRKIGPHEQSGLYEITDKGRAVLKHRDKYGRDDVDFDALVEQELDS